MKKLITYIFLFFVNVSITFSTNQISDRLIRGEDTLYLRTSPFSIEKGFLKKIEEKTPYLVSTNCWNKFWAEWKIVNNQIYLVDIKSCNKGESLINEFNDYFGLTLTENGYLASWVNGVYWGEYGKLVEFETGSYFENEIKLTIENGIIIESKEWKAKKCFQENWEDYLKEYIYRNIDWNLFDYSEIFKNEFEFKFSTNKNGNIEITELKVYYKFQEKIRDEIIRILKKIDCWNIYYYHGEIIEDIRVLNIEFDNIKKEKYAR